MASDTETSVLEARRVDTRVDTGTIRRIVCGGDSDTEVWYTDGDPPLDVVETTESTEGLEWVPKVGSGSQKASAVVVTGLEHYWDGEDSILRHRRREMFGMALFSALTRPVRSTSRGMHALCCVAVEATLRAYLIGFSALGGFLEQVFSKVPWLVVLGWVKRALAPVWARLRAGKWAVMRQRARYRAAGRRTDWGFTIRRQIAVRASKASFAISVAVGSWWVIAITTLFLTGQFSMPAVLIGIGTTGLFLVAGFVFDTVAERADLHRYDMVIQRLPANLTRKERASASFWMTETRTDIELPRPVSPRAHERAQAGVMPLRPASEPERRVLAATRTDWVPEAGAWF